ncbi:uncharacterized protein METZ01_LOCUS115795, partial [marine metagenome]
VGVKYSNNASTSLPGGISDSATSITVTDASSFPAISSPDYAYLTLVSATALEVVKCTDITGNVLTVIREQEDTDASAFVTDDRVELRVTTAMLTDALAETVAAAAASAAAAATSETNAAASYDNFDDRWLGSKSSDPSVDNDGATLLDGAAYFNTTTNVLMVYDLGGTTWNTTTPSSSEQTNINTVAGIAANVTTVAGISANTTTVAGISANVTTVAGISSDVTAVAGDATDIGAVAAKATEIGRLGTADAVADMAILGTADVVTDMNVLATADVVTDMNTLGTADVVADMNVLGTADVVTDMNVLATADVVTDMNVLATADVVTDMNTLGTADVVTDMNTLGTSANVTAMSTCADNLTGINNFADRYRTGSSDPVSDLDEGDLAYNSTANVLKYYNGSAWVTIVAGSLTAVVQDGAPQLGGQLDVNGNAIGDGTLELLKFSETGSAVNEFTIANAAAGNGPTLSATGTETDVDINITPKGDGDLILDGLKYPQADGDADQFLKTNGSAQLSFETIQGGDISTEGTTFANYNTITDNTTTTTVSTKNMFLMGDISVADTKTWTIAGNGALTII